MAHAESRYRHADWPERLSLKTLLQATAAVLVVVTILWGIDYVLRPDTFPVRTVSFEGEFKQVTQAALAKGVNDVVSGNFFLIDLEVIKQHAERVPWVHKVSVRRQWPDGVHVRFSEQVLMARWNQDAWINVDGERVNLRGQPGPRDLPQLSGPEGSHGLVLDHFQNLSAILNLAGLTLTQLRLTDRHNWEIGLHTGMTVIVGREDPEPKVERFARLYPHTLAAEADNIREVDLRYTNGFAVQWINRKGAALPRAEG